MLDPYKINLKYSMLKLIAEDGDFNDIEEMKRYLRRPSMTSASSTFTPIPIDEFKPVADGINISAEGVAAILRDEVDVVKMAKEIGLKYYAVKRQR